MKKIIDNEFSLHTETLLRLSSNTAQIEEAAKNIISKLESGGKILLFGNGGSAADAQHIAAELVGRYKKNRVSIPAIALTTDTSIITSISNDFGYDLLFSRQIQALASDNDVAIGITTSGNSKNVLDGLILAKENGCYCIGLTGSNDSSLLNCTDLVLSVPSDNTPRVQEMHILIGHILCELVDCHFSTETQ